MAMKHFATWTSRSQAVTGQSLAAMMGIQGPPETLLTTNFTGPFGVYMGCPLYRYSRLRTPSSLCLPTCRILKGWRADLGKFSRPRNYFRTLCKNWLQIVV